MTNCENVAGRVTLAGFVEFALCVGALGLITALPLKAFGGDPGSPNIQAARENNTGVAFMNQQLLANALGHFEAAHKADPASVTPLLNKGLALLYLNRLPEADTVLEEAAQSAPTSARAWYGLGLARFGAGNQEQALVAFKKSEALAPDDADSHYYVGALELALKDLPGSVEEFEKTIALNPLHASAYYGLARALQRSGKPADSRVKLQRFQEITQNKIGVLFSPTYGEQGHFALAQDMLASPVAAGPMIPVKFEAASSHTAANAPIQGGGACLLDLDGDGRKALVSLGGSGNAIHVFRLGAAGEPQEVDAKQTGLSAMGEGVSCAVGDYDNDGLPDVAIALKDRVAIFHNLGHGKFADTTAALGIKPTNQPSGVTFVDFDHDGDLDLYVTGAGSKGVAPSTLWRNNGNSTFTEWTAPTALGGTADTAAATLSDINNDRAVDLVVSGKDPAPAVYENQREGAFRRVALYDDAALGATRGVLAFDFNKDGWMDVAVSHAGAPGISLWKNVEGKRFERVQLPTTGVTQAWGLTSLDLDNDGWIDLAALVEDGKGTHVRVFRNLGPQGFSDVSDTVGLGTLNLPGARVLLAADVDGDGASDLIVGRGDLPPLLLHNAGGSANHSLRLTLAGLADNKPGIGTKVEVFVNGSVQKFEMAGASGYLGQGAGEIIAGLGKEEHADIVRLLWPTGVPQDELQVAASKPAHLTELDRRGSSCPVLFAWNGKRYDFVTDVIGAAVMGHWMSPTRRNQSDADEWVKVDGSQLRARDGKLSLRFGEPMEEINYIDQLRLVAIDHPEGTEVYPDERFLEARPFAKGTPMLASAGSHLPRAAHGDHGQDVLPLLAQRDHKYVRDFENLSYAGFAKRHSLTLDLGAWSPERPLRLFLSGFVEYFSASSMYAAWQAKLAPEPPTLEAQMPDGSWKEIVHDMGFPAGLPRTIVVDLTGKLPAHATNLRIRTNLQIYWDQVLVDNEADQPGQIRQTELPLSTATLAFRGYPKQIDGATPGDLTYDYQSISATGPFQWQRGNYTRFGKVTPLLEGKDNQFVIFGSGEDIDAEFSDAPLPALPSHWKRDYFFYADGFVKDMDFYEALPYTVSQLPFQGMSRYPYPASEHYPETNETLKYRLDWNERFETGDRVQPFQFDYKPSQSVPIP